MIFGKPASTPGQIRGRLSPDHALMTVFGRAWLPVAIALGLAASATAGRCAEREPIKFPDTQYEPVEWASLDGWATDDHATAYPGSNSQPKQAGRAAAHSVPILGDRRSVGIDFEVTIQLEPLLECPSQLEIAKSGKIGVGDHHRVLAIEKTGYRYSDCHDLVSLVRHGIEHWPQLVGNCIDQVHRLATGFCGNTGATKDSAILSHDSDFRVCAPDIDCSGKTHQSAALASSGFFQRSIGFAIPWGRKGREIFRPSPADA